MAITEIYVDPSLASDTGDGSIGTPFGDLEYAIEQSTFDTTNGTRVNIRAGTDEILAAKIDTAMADTSVSVAWVPSDTAGLVFEGYASAAGDGGVGGVSGGGAVSIFADTVTTDNIHFKNLHLHNTGSNMIIGFDNHCSFKNCEFSNATAQAIQGGNYVHIEGCHFHDLTRATGNIINTSTIGSIIGCYFEDIDLDDGEIINATGNYVARNIIIMSSVDTTAIRILNSAKVEFNSIYQPLAGTQPLIEIADTTHLPVINNNLIEGASGVGGKGIELQYDHQALVYGNAIYDCTTAYDLSTATLIHEEDNETLSASPFTDAANGDFRPVDTGNVREGALPQDVAGQ